MATSKGASVTVSGERILDRTDILSVPVGETYELSRQLVEISQGEFYTRRLVKVGDISDEYPTERDEFNNYLDGLSDVAAKNKHQWQVPTKENGFQTNAARSMFYNRFPGNLTMLEWQKYIMEARALYPLQRPDDATRVLPGGVDEYAMNVFMFAMDSIGIRSRAAIMKQVGFKAIEGIEDTEVAVLSLGSGAAVPLIDAVNAIREKLGKTVKMDLCDLSGESLALAVELMKEAGIPAEDLNEAFVGHFIRKLHEMKKSGAPVDMVEALGLFEYLEDKGASDLIKDSYNLLKQGGVIIVSNMLDSRRQLEFNQYGVGWPDVVPRSEAELVQLAIDAGIDAKDITITIAEDGVYAVMEIHKP